MSLILEALKKSEAQRRLGQAPNLGTPITAARRRRSILPWLIVAVLVAAVSGWWLLRPRAPAESGKPAAGATTAATAVAPSPAGPNAARKAAKAAARAAVASPADGATAPPPISIVPTPHAAAPPAATAPAMPHGAAEATPASHAPAATKPPANGESARTPSPAPLPAVASTTVPPAKPAANAPTAPVAPTAPAQAAPAAPPVSAPATAAVAAEPALPTMYDLSPDFRAGLPKLPVSMLFYSSDPARRFILVDGERKKEGDMIGEVAVREIRASGAVLEFRGQRFLLPRPGS